MRPERFHLGEREENAVNRIMTLITGGKAMSSKSEKTKPITPIGKPNAVIVRDSAIKAAKKSPSTCVVIDFARIPNGLDILEAIKSEAEKNFRDPDKQILFSLKQAGGF